MNDSNEITALAASFVARNLPFLVQFGRSFYQDAKNQLPSRLKAAYTTYIHRTTERYGRSKSFFIRDVPTNIYEFYIPLGLKAGKTKLRQASFDSAIELATRIVVTAPAGAGKSMLLRHFFLSALKTSDRIPILLELRNLGKADDAIVEAIYDALKTFGFNLSDAYINKALIRGHFIVLLDGFDEIPYDSRRTVSAQIDTLADKAPSCIIIVSSRPDDTFKGWDDFAELTIAPLDVDEACELVAKLPFDEDLKEKFLSDLKEFLFDRHKSFLSNPLLLSIMLLTYGESADIPNKLSLFYNQAYEALFHRHDALKGGYQRERKTFLDVQDFARVFAAFCLQTYDNRRFQFSRSNALECIRKAKDYVSIDVLEDDYLHDCLQSVCLLMEDGLNIVFSHRSFQEYFVARYILDADPRIQRELLDRFVGQLERDNVYKLLYEINPELIERELLVPKLQQIFVELGVKRMVGITHFLRFLKMNFSQLEFNPQSITFSHRETKHDSVGNVNVIVFSYKYCVSTTDKNLNQQTQAKLISMYAKDSPAQYDVDKLTLRSAVTQDLAKSSGLFSIQGLQQVYQVYRRLKHKQKNVPKSLEALLK